MAKQFALHIDTFSPFSFFPLLSPFQAWGDSGENKRRTQGISPLCPVFFDFYSAASASGD